ncbi:MULTISPECIES: TolC family protein [unclassified Zunongwangia]|uniref:TolC family protein n=1 Tax=unclassified Zunongwangia TaxID=2632541 RepID=UPI0022DD1DB4|nr:MULTISPECIES: TolC family protein [unclassified Zunongwangia]WBL22899.1 TolC family protein [Zunongwangia sp. HRR-M8]WBL25192.1 TolC family protein [Zunongwangia sp. HGR-M22]
MNIKITYFTVIFFMFIGLATKAQDSLLTKNEVIARALDSNFGIKMANNNVEVAENNQSILNSGYLPSLRGAGGYNYDLNNRLTEPEEGDNVDQRGIEGESYSASINLDYTLFDGLGRFYNYKSLKEQYNLSQLEARETIENTILQLLTVYYEIARLSENMGVLKETLKISQDRVKRAQYQFEYGQSNNLVVLNARVDVNTDSINLIETRQQLRNTKRDLNVILNRDVNNRAFEVDTSVSFITELRIDSFLEQSTYNNVSLLKAKSNIILSDYDIKVSKSGYLPTVGLTGSYGWNRNISAATAFFPGSKTTTDGLSAGLSLSWDLFDGGLTSVAIQNAKINKENQQLQKKQIELEVERDIANALGNYENKLYIFRVQEENVLTNEDNFSRSEEQYRLGQISSIEFRQAQINLLDAKTSLNLAKYDAKLAELELLQLTGQLLNIDF